MDMPAVRCCGFSRGFQPGLIYTYPMRIWRPITKNARLAVIVVAPFVGRSGMGQCSYETSVFHGAPCAPTGPPSIEAYGISDLGKLCGGIYDCEFDQYAYWWDGS